MLHGLLASYALLGDGTLLLAPLLPALQVMGAMVMVCWLAALLTGNYSQVDRIWSVSPVLFAWLYVVQHSGLFGEASVGLGVFRHVGFVQACLVTLWGFRLSFNLWRK